VTIVLRRIRALAVLLPAALTLSCFEQPITESIAIRFLPRDLAMVRVTVRLADPKQFKENPAARDRIEAARRAIVELRDPWSDRIASLAPEEERITWDRSHGEVARFDHRALITETDRLHSFFKDTLVQAGVTRWEDAMEFVLTPWPGSRAGRLDQDRFGRAMDDWATVAVNYLRAGRSLYDYLDANPERARACFASLFKDLLSQDVRSDAGELTDRDEEVVDPFSDAMAALLEVFSVPSGEAYSVEELSALVHDPFPAPLTVQVPGPVLEVEGFEAGDGDVLRVPTMSLWSAFTRLQTRWITPDPAIVLYQHLGHGKQPLDLDAFLAQPRSATPPVGPSEVVRALAEEMRTAPVYRVRWSTAGLEEPDGEGDLWDLPELQ
jgi:hypothetical protein